MPDWLVLLNEQVSADDTVTALRAAVPPPWRRLVLLGAEQRWRPPTSGVPIAYRAERSAALRAMWARQEARLRTCLEEIAGRVAKDTWQLELYLFWGDPVGGAHQLAHTLQLSLIIYPIRPTCALRDYWPGSLPWRLVRDAPCSVLLARIPSGRERAQASRLNPGLRSSLAR